MVSSPVLVPPQSSRQPLMTSTCWSTRVKEVLKSSKSFLVGSWCGTGNSEMECAGMIWRLSPPKKKAMQTTWSLLNFGRPSQDSPCLRSKIPKHFPFSPITSSFSHSNNLSINGIPSFVQQVSAVASAPFRRYWPAAPASAAPPRSHAPGSACARGVVAMQPFVGSWSPPRGIKDQLSWGKTHWITMRILELY